MEFLEFLEKKVLSLGVYTIEFLFTMFLFYFVTLYFLLGWLPSFGDGCGGGGCLLFLPVIKP
jgi:hypothetical protein